MLRAAFVDNKKPLLAGLLVWVSVTCPVLVHARQPVPVDGLATVAAADLPPQGRQTLQLIHDGGPFPYSKDGTVFGNRERLLPARQRGYYLEYTVKTPGSRDRGARRIVGVIAGGTAGLVTAAFAAGLGAKVALIERHLMGGDCLNVGSVPSKALIRASRAWADVRRGEEFGLASPARRRRISPPS